MLGRKSFLKKLWKEHINDWAEAPWVDNYISSAKTRPDKPRIKYKNQEIPVA